MARRFVCVIHRFKPGVSRRSIRWGTREEQEAPVSGEKVMRFAQILVAEPGRSFLGTVDSVGSSTTGGSPVPGACSARANCQ
jgi:hypothetical protein